MRLEMGGDYEFIVTAVRHDFTNAPHLQGLEVEWRVALPHQCDQGSITGHAGSAAEAIEKLATFIGEAQATLERLRALPEDAHDLA